MSFQWCISDTHLRLITTTTFFIILTFLPPTTSTTTTTRDHPCRPPNHNHYPFCNTSLPTLTRALSLLSLLALPEKLLQLSNNASPIPRLGLPPYQWWSESLHGVASNGPGVSFKGSVPAATSFPQVILSAASFNRTLWRLVAEAIAEEARAMHDVGQAGLTFWAPNINVFRDPRWGRGQETPGEDPMVAAAYAVEYVLGFQGEVGGGGGGGKRVLGEDVGGGRMRLSACCKHFTAYDLEKWGGFARYTFNAKVTEQDMEDTYQPPFRGCIEEGHASCLMCSYNQVNGVPACARHDLLNKARNEWGFKGYITSDCDAVAIIYENQSYAHSPEDAVADVLKAGMDINCGTYLLRHTESAVEQGKVSEEDIDRALLNLFTVQMRLGIFDGENQFGNLGPWDVCTEKHRELALNAARQGIVLLKNDNRFLPLKKVNIASLAVIGPAANDTSKLGGGYSGVPCNPISLFEGLQAYAERASYAYGCLDIACQTEHGFKEAIHIARNADVVVVVAGIDLTQETEDLDRVSLLLPGRQTDLINTIARESRRPIVLVLMGGGPIDVSFAKHDPKIASILWVGYPGEAGGRAVAEVIFGEFNPGGRLPVTWYPESFTKIPMNDMNMRADPSRGYPGRTYRFYTGEVVYGFGYGLSYSNFSYRFLSVPHTISFLGSYAEADAKKIKNGLDFVRVADVPSCEALRFDVQVSVDNHGDMDGSHTVLLFSRPETKIRGAAQKQLVGFTRVHTRSYESVEANISIDPCKHFSLANENGQQVLPLGVHSLMLGYEEHTLTIGTY
ncbi:putative beta-D-xylosidase 6 [Acorus calamus]|uniref:Beta-D-xylosidase 6 n=1 Tax=Acorus calamus TaxID=4465 RepID=A0AAV9DEP9_ACOCL|nr:putative beta-D-xylosidase 6 [Acorus calamus]